MSNESKITSIKGTAIAIVGNDIDTDRIIPSRFLRCVTFDALGEQAFADDIAGEKEKGNIHPFIDPKFTGAEILFANQNFGCGSSREHAPQALSKWGIKAIVAVSFAEIFFNNNIAMGIPCLVVNPDEADGLQKAILDDPKAEVNINIETAEISVGANVVKATIAEGPKEMFLSGNWDATGVLLANKESIEKTVSNLPYMKLLA